MKLKEANGVIRPIDNFMLFAHLFNGKAYTFSDPSTWKFIEQMCAAHNEPFERVR